MLCECGARWKLQKNLWFNFQVSLVLWFFYFWFLPISFGLQVDNQLTWKNHIDQMISNLCVARSAVLHQQTLSVMAGMEPRSSLKRG
jgi:hypothetical protein